MEIKKHLWAHLAAGIKVYTIKINNWNSPCKLPEVFGSSYVSKEQPFSIINYNNTYNMLCGIMQVHTEYVTQLIWNDYTI